MKIDVKHVAKLANLQISEDELPKFEKQLSEVLQYVDQLQSVDTQGVKETSQVTGLENILRVDVAKESLSQEAALSNAKNKHNNLFQVKGILENS
ncbi:MAG TPA: Asp-tRNA(Asn)/Glu-tRNA(Gln) amidotransferase subunit GatC [Patescibacteria group bacterium]|nr:Asp-tRNA(Asn)/Glu-tRNA(Gln) amidotransferase subunit GatC [Patescibacteria group bacterium]